jgi:uncharacterized membrane protein
MNPSNSSNEINLSALDRNIETVHRMRQDADENRDRHQVFADKVASFLGRIINLYFHVVLYGGWLLYMLFISKNAETIFSSLAIMGSVATIEALFFSIFILINQRRKHALERRNSDLHLQMSMLAEHEVTRLIRMTHQIASHMGLRLDEKGGELEELKKDIRPDQILEKINQHESDKPTHSTED